MLKNSYTNALPGQKYSKAQTSDFSEYWSTLQRLGSFKDTIRLSDVAKVPVPAPLPHLTWTVVEAGGSGYVTIDTASTELRAFLMAGGCEQQGITIVVPPSKVKELPHDFGHFCIDHRPQGSVRIPGTNLTPDIVTQIPAGFVAIEVSTTQRDSDQGIANSIGTKVASYHHLYSKNLIVGFNVCCITATKVTDLTGSLGPEYSCLSAAYSTGLQISRRFYSEYSDPGEKNGDDAGKRALQTLFSMSGVGQETDIPMSYLQKRPDLPYEPIIGHGTYKTPLGKFSDYETAAKSLKGRDLGKSLIHIPMVVVNTNRAKLLLPRSEGSGVYSTIFNACSDPLSIQHERSFESLVSESAFYADETPAQRSDRIGSKKKQSQSNDFVVFRVDHNSAVELATRGVNAKRFASDPVIKARAAEKHLPYNWADRSTFDFLDQYFESDVRLAKARYHEPIDPDFQSIQGMNDLADVFQEAQAIHELQAALFLTCIVAEIAANVKRHTDCEKAQYKLIVRRIFGWDAFIVMRTTSYGENSNFQYCVYFKGEAICPGLYEHVEELSNGWSYTKFVTMDRDKLSHMQGFFARTLAMLGMLVNSTGEPLSHETTFEDFHSSVPALRCLMSIDLADDAQLAETLQLLRFYYGNLMSGVKGSKQMAESVISDVPVALRSGLTMFFLQQLIDLHQTIDEDIHLRMNSVVRSKDDTAEQSIAELAEYALEDGIACPFKFTLYTADQILIAIYACMLRNKDEGDAGYGSKVIMEKLLKGEYLSLSLKKDQTAVSFHQKDTCDPDELGKFQFSRNALAHGARLLRAQLARDAGYQRWNEEDIDILINTAVAHRLAQQHVEDAATTKASTVPFDPDLTITIATNANTKDDQDQSIAGIGLRRKCIFQILKAIDDGVLKHPIISENIELIAERLIKTEKGLQVTLFKKNQITGVREIYVLTIAGRLFMRTYNDVARAVCELIPQEMLTHPEDKAGFIAKHYRNVQNKAKELGLTHAVRFRWSGDMTQWANLFSLMDHAAFLAELLPKEYAPMIQMAAHLLRSKHVQIPRKTIESWVKSYDTYISTGELEHVKKLEAEFKRHKLPAEVLRGPQKVVMKILTNMMQGIPHYVSSLYHCAHMLCLKEVIEEWCSARGVVCVFDFELSSDDEGALMTILSDQKEKLHAIVPELIRKWPRIKHSIDAMWGVRTSNKKSVLALADWFEFNSAFFVKNTIASAIIKFVARSCDDPPEQSLHDRVSSLLTALASVRDNGGSGYLCHWVSMCQQQSLMFSMGATWCSWFTREVYDAVTVDKLTHQGYLPVSPPHLAGLIGCDFINWVACENRSSRIVLQTLMGQSYSSEPLEEEAEYAHKLNYGMFPTDKYKNALISAGIDYSVDSVIKESDLRIIICGPGTIIETQRLCKLRVCSVGIARSMAHLTRSDVLAVGVFLLWAAVYKTPDGKTNMSRARDKLVAKFKGDPLDRESLFPLHIGFSSAASWTKVSARCGRTGGARRLKYSNVNPIAAVSEHHAAIKKLLRHAWFSESSGFPSRVAASLWAAVTIDLPYLCSSTAGDNGPALTLAHPRCPAKDYRQLLGFIEDYAQTPRVRKMLMRGHASAGNTSIETLITKNSSDSFDYFFDDEPDDYDEEQRIAPDSKSKAKGRAAEDYLRAWVDLAYASGDGSEAIELLNNDVGLIANEVPEAFWASLDGANKTRYAVPKLLGFMANKISFNRYCEVSSSVEVFLQRPKWDGSALVGPHEKVIYTEHGAAYGKSDGKTWATQSALPRSVVSKFFSGALRHSTAVFRPNANDYRFHRLVWLDDAIWIMLRSPSGTAFMQLPKLSMHSDHAAPYERPTSLWQYWINRQAPNADELGDLMVEMLKASKLSKGLSVSVLRYAKRMKQQRSVPVAQKPAAIEKQKLKLSEHLHSRIAMLDKADVRPPSVLKLGSSWAESEDRSERADEEDQLDDQEFLDCYTKTIEDSSSWTDADFRGFRVHAFEYQEAARHFNPCLRAVDDAIHKLRGLSRSMLSESAIAILSLYEDVL